MSKPSCKGVLLQSAVAAVRIAIRDGRLQREAVEARLEANDLLLLEDKVNPTSWYPVGSLGRFLELTSTLLGGPSEAVYRRLGELSADSTSASGMYQQLEFDDGALDEWSPANVKRFSRLLATIWGAFYNFSSWRVEVDEEAVAGGGRRTVAVAHWEDVAPLSNALCPITAGFIKALFERASGGTGGVDVEADVVADDHFRFRVRRY